LTEGQDMRRPRFEARHLFDLLAGVLTLTAAMSATIPFPLAAGAAAKGKIVLAWHAGLASRWLDPQEHDGSATPVNYLSAIQDARIKSLGIAIYNQHTL